MGSRHRLITFFFLTVTLFMVTLDNQIVSSALPTLIGEFGETDHFEWVTSSYLLGMSATMPLYGKLGDLFGRKRIVQIAVAIFVVSSVACGLADSMNALIAARLAQGMGGGGLMVSIFAINADIFEPRERARYLGYSSLVIAASGGLGATLGGWMSSEFGWRSVFFINLPIGLVAFVGLSLVLLDRRPAATPSIDYPGALLLACFISCVIVFSDRISQAGFALEPVATSVLVIGFAVCALWIRVERRAVDPVVPLSLFRERTFTISILVAFCAGAVSVAMVNVFALLLQMGLGMAPAKAGLALMATACGTVLGSMSSGRLISRTGRYKAVAVSGLALNATSLFMFTRLTADTQLLPIIGLMTLQGIAVGFGQQAPMVGVQSSAPVEHMGAATGAVTLMRMAGASIAISLYGALLGAGLRNGAIAQAQSVRSDMSPALLHNLSPAAYATSKLAYLSALWPVFMVATGIALCGLVAAITLKPSRLPQI